jgi:predicted P-loop ATPase/GTPase
MKILIAGILAFESGKTTLALGLAREFKSRGFSVGYLKPVAGHNGWFQQDTVEYTRATSVLVGHDAYVVASELGLTREIPILNPIDILTLPLDPFLEDLTLRRYLDYMSSSLRTAVLVRFSKIGGSSLVNDYFVIGENVSRLSSVSLALYNTIISVIGENSSFIEISIRELEDLMNNPETYKEIDRTTGLLEEREVMLVEGYNDVSAPTPSSCESDYAIAVAPTRAALYDGSKYCRGIQVLSPNRPWLARTVSVLELIGKPLRKFNIPHEASGAEFKRSVSDIVDSIIGKA